MSYDHPYVAADHPYVAALRRHLHPYFKRHAHATNDSWPVADLCRAYAWPNCAPGGGTIGIIELGGGWHTQDVAQFCSVNGIALPLITDVSVDGTTNRPGDPADGEVALDIQVAAASYAVATGGLAAKLRIYFAQDITAAIVRATADGCDVCSISWGADEAVWGVAQAQALEAACEAATAAGMVVLAASGDNDSGDGGRTPANVDLPAAAPHVIGCGGTNKPHSGGETVWNNNPGASNGSGTGGGYSTIFPPQAWQVGAPIQNAGGRLVPDLAAAADPQTGYEIFVGGRAQIIGGTSAVAPLCAGLFAAFGTKLGFITPLLYRNPAAFSDITVGDNGTWDAAVGVDPCTGLGSPLGAKLLVLLGGGTP